MSALPESPRVQVCRRFARSLALAVVLVASAECDAGRGESKGAPKAVDGLARTVTLFNACDDVREYVVADRVPEVGVRRETILPTRMIDLELVGKQRVWLWEEAGWDQARSATAMQDGWVVQINDGCHAIMARPGPP